MAVSAGLLTSAAVEKALATFRKDRYISASVERAILDLLHEVTKKP